MTEATGALMTEPEYHLSFFDRVSAWAAWGLAGTIFLTVGWSAMAPDDPLGAISVLTRGGAWMMLLQAAGLATVTAAVAMVLAGRRLPEAGTFAAAVGLAAVSLRGGTAGSLLIQWSGAASDSGGNLPIRLAVEAMGWFAIVLVARVLSIGVGHWCFGGESGYVHEPRATGGAEPPRETPTLSGRVATVAQGIKHIILAGGAALVVFKVLTAGLSTRSVQHGQACFVVAASVCIALYFAYWFVPVRSAVWSILSVPLLAVGGYVWASLGAAPDGLPSSVPSSPYLRVLPIQYIAVGTGAAVAMFWYFHHPARYGPDPGHAAPEGSG